MDKLILFSSIVSCIVIQQKENVIKSTSTYNQHKYIQYEKRIDPDTSVAKKMEISQNEEDIIINDYLSEQLKPIRQNFKRINSIDQWTTINNKELWETTEGGEASYYYTNSNLEKIITMEYGETFQKVTEFYFMQNEISFVIEKNCKYNRQIYYDSTLMVLNNDTEVFDFEKSEVIVDRSYFEKEKLIHQICDGDCGAPFSDEYLSEEEIRIKTKIEVLLKSDK